MKNDGMGERRGKQEGRDMTRVVCFTSVDGFFFDLRRLKAFF